MYHSWNSGLKSTIGLAVGVLLACVAFVAQSAPAGPLRGSMSAATLRSSAWRSTSDLEVLDQVSRNVHVVQLKGHLFFGNIHKLSDYISDLMVKYPELECLVVDFTLVVAMDSSAADRLSKLKYVSYVCAPYECRLVFTAIPSAYTRFLRVMLVDESPVFHVADDLNDAIEWSENELLRRYKVESTLQKEPSLPKEHSFLARLHNLSPAQPLSVLEKLLEYFDRQVSEGAMVGELCLLTGEKRKTTVVTMERCVVYVLTEARFKDMLDKDSLLAFVFQGIALRYVSLRLQYVGNRIWETKCLPI
ncbi:hypothetical protein DYB25_013315 [Aphanomyces astaci]|uniref:Cyclic nucleotide-binding domain-containing protein n=2 Tax=Aphanomyces astaci TaxID=112090 RepID=A0A397BRT9_APHAT|nr:hypothetical protein DYB25_013315 [Aphanomyces astaci]